MHLISTELRDPYTPRKCLVVKRLRSELRDDLALVEIEPPLPASVYNTPEDIRQVILATRHQGTSLFPVTEWPLPVYICVLKDNTASENGVLKSSNLAILDWGEVQE